MKSKMSLYAGAIIVVLGAVLWAILLPSTHAKVVSGGSPRFECCIEDHRILLRILIVMAGVLVAVALSVFARMQMLRHSGARQIRDREE